MELIVHFLTQYGYWGMLLAAFLAGSFFPFSSEAVLIGLMATGLDPWILMIYGTVGNVLGSIVNYCLGRMGKMEWIEKYLHVKKADLDKAHRFLCLPAHLGQCHHDSPRTDALQRRHHLHCYHLRQDFPLYRPNIWRWFVYVS